MADGIIGTIEDTQGLKQVSTEIDPIFKLFGESMPMREGPVIVSTKNIAGQGAIYGSPTYGLYGTSRYWELGLTRMIWGSADKGIWGTALWGADGVSFILGSSTYGVLSISTLGSSNVAFNVVKVVNPSNVWRELVRTTQFENSAVGGTTATWDTTNFKWTFASGQKIVTTEIALNDETIVSATVNINTSQITNPTNLSWYLTADGGTNWEAVTLNTEHTFTNPGTDLRIKVSASGGAAEVAIDDADSVSYPIEVSYKTS